MIVAMRLHHDVTVGIKIKGSSELQAAADHQQWWGAAAKGRSPKADRRRKKQNKSNDREDQPLATAGLAACC